MISTVMFFNTVFQIAGIFMIILGLWELRIGINRKKYIQLMTAGLLLIFIVPIVTIIF
ncbi:hypothetical protein [Bacillus solimangrovi]|uniref:hypothetical protein n=1 Tax=Bacillus solimangrovi TaxID=1305675 RepID=UPI001586E9C5|nr:hypothetical protein [Bacillus solimangrovi]